MIRKLIIFFYFFFVSSFPLFCQTHLAVQLNHPVYNILETAEIKGALKNLPFSKPYSKSYILLLLKQAYNNKKALTKSEQAIIKQMISEFENTNNGITRGNILFSGYMGNTMIGLKATGDILLNINNPGIWHMNNALNIYLGGDIASFLSYYGSFGVTYDKVNPDSFVPYSFSKKWDRFHINFGEPRYSIDGIEAIPYFSFTLGDEICSEFFNNNLLLRWGRLRRDWGPSEGTLYLSKNARPYEGIDLYAYLTKSIRLSFTFGSLANWLKESELKSDPDAISYEKMFTLQMLEFIPFEWFSLSVAASAVWGKRFEIGYLNPLMYPVMHQNLHGDFDNVTQSANFVFNLPRISKIYFSFLADEMEFSNIEKFFSNPRNMIGIQAGTKTTLPFFSFSLLTLQYTKIEPFVYSHSPEVHPYGGDALVNLSYTHDNENLGSYLKPNSDEFLVKMESRILPNFAVSLQYQLIRHGTNDEESDEIAIYGNVDEYFHYDEIDQYPDKAFLKDGLYDWNSIISLKVSWEIPAYSAALTFGYSFSHTWWIENNSGLSTPDNEMKNIFSISYEIF